VSSASVANKVTPPTAALDASVYRPSSAIERLEQEVRALRQQLGLQAEENLPGSSRTSFANQTDSQ
jgi:hypothetical protein